MLFYNQPLLLINIDFNFLFSHFATDGILAKYHFSATIFKLLTDKFTGPRGEAVVGRVECLLFFSFLDIKNIFQRQINLFRKSWWIVMTDFREYNKTICHSKFIKNDTHLFLSF